MSIRRRYIYFLLTYFHNNSKKEHITKYSIKSTINSAEAANLPIVVCPVGPQVLIGLQQRRRVTSSLARRLTRRPVMF